MEFDKRKYIYITIVVLLAVLTLYVTYSLIKDGHPIDKTQNEHLRDANELHNDGKYEEAIESYMEASDFDSRQSLVNYNIAVNSLKKNYNQLNEAFNEEGTQLDKNIDLALVAANKKLEKAALLQDDVEKYSEVYHNIGVAYHMRDSLNAAAEAYKEALRKDPANENARYNLAVILYQMKQNQEQQQQKQDNKDKEKEEKDKKQEKQEIQDKKEEQQEQQNSEQQEKDEELKKIERELKALMQEEMKVREKIDNAEKVKVRRSNRKNW